MPDIRRERKEAAESLTEKKKDIKNKKILHFLFTYHFLVFCVRFVRLFLFYRTF